MMKKSRPWRLSWRTHDMSTVLATQCACLMELTVGLAGIEKEANASKPPSQPQPSVSRDTGRLAGGCYAFYDHTHESHEEACFADPTRVTARHLCRPKRSKYTVQEGSVRAWFALCYQAVFPLISATDTVHIAARPHRCQHPHGRAPEMRLPTQTRLKSFAR